MAERKNPVSLSQIAAAAREEPFHLYGVARLHVSEEEFDEWMQENRARQAALAAAKLASL